MLAVSFREGPISQKMLFSSLFVNAIFSPIQKDPGILVMLHFCLGKAGLNHECRQCKQPAFSKDVLPRKLTWNPTVDGL